jgi:molybdenum cofactor biosynthesis enzyme
MTSNIFQSFKEASEYAAKCARDTRAKVSLKRNEDKWQVTIQQGNSTEITHNIIVKKQNTKKINGSLHIRQSLKIITPCHPIQIIHSSFQLRERALEVMSSWTA